MAATCGVGHMCCLDLVLLWLWYRLAAAALIWPPSLRPSICHRCGCKKEKKKKKTHHFNHLIIQVSGFCCIRCVVHLSPLSDPRTFLSPEEETCPC